MPWSTTRPGSHPKYATRQHREYVAHLKRKLKDEGVLMCVADECVMPTRAITNPNGSHQDGLTAGHNPDGITYRGPEHRKCNALDGSRRARARQNQTTLKW